MQPFRDMEWQLPRFCQQMLGNFFFSHWLTALFSGFFVTPIEREYLPSGVICVLGISQWFS
jgi:hypothetical protein